MQKRIPIPPRLGGGDVVMRVLTTGEYEDRLKSHAGAKSVSAGFVDIQAELVMASTVAFQGKPLPVGAEREEWWRALDMPLRQFMAACYNKLNTVADQEIEDFFGAAETVGPGSTSSLKR